MNFECDGRKEGAQKAPVIFERRRPMLYGLDPIQFILEIMPRNLPAFEIKKVNAREREKERVCFKLHAFQIFAAHQNRKQDCFEWAHTYINTVALL